MALIACSFPLNFPLPAMMVASLSTFALMLASRLGMFSSDAGLKDSPALNALTIKYSDFWKE